MRFVKVRMEKIVLPLLFWGGVGGGSGGWALSVTKVKRDSGSLFRVRELQYLKGQQIRGEEHR